VRAAGPSGEWTVAAVADADAAAAAAAIVAVAGNASAPTNSDDGRGIQLPYGSSLKFVRLSLYASSFSRGGAGLILHGWRNHRDGIDKRSNRSR